MGNNFYVDPVQQPCPPVLPMVLDDGHSYIEQVNKLRLKINELIEMFNQQKQLYATIEMLLNSQHEQDIKWGKELQEQYDLIMGYVVSEIVRLEKIIADTIAGKVTIFDPTSGITPQPVEDVVARIYHWLRYYADYAEVIDSLQLTADERDSYALDAKTFDLYSSLYYSHSSQPTPMPEDIYVQKHDILAYYFDRKL